MDFEQQPTIDWDKATRLAGNNRQAAEEFLDLFLKHLNTDLKAIKQHYAEKNYAALRNAVHKLHGAVSYCGLPRLKSLLQQLESNLKNDIVENLPEKMSQLDTEIKAIKSARN